MLQRLQSRADEADAARDVMLGHILELKQDARAGIGEAREAVKDQVSEHQRLQARSSARRASYSVRQRRTQHAMVTR